MMEQKIQHYRFLVNLRNSGTTNMFGASPYLEDAFDLEGIEANSILSDWMKSFDLPKDEQPQDGR